MMWYAGLDVHAAATAITLRDAKGVIRRRAVVPTHAVGLRRFFRNIRGLVRIACESGPMAEWVFRTLSTRYREVIVCDARKTRLLSIGTKNDRIDADKLSELLRIAAVHPVYIVTPRNSELRQMVAHYHRAIGDRVRAIQRVRALFRQYGVQLATRWGTRRSLSLRKLPNATARQIVRANLRVIGLATLVRDEARAQVIALAQSSPHFQLLQSIPYVGEMRAAEFIAIVETPHRFTSVRSFWAYAGLAVVHRVSADRPVDGAETSKRKAQPRGLRLSAACQPRLRRLFREISTYASIGRGVFRDIYDGHLARGKRSAVARIALARKVASIVLAVWRKGEPFKPAKLKVRKHRQSRGEHRRVSSVPTAPHGQRPAANHMPPRAVVRKARTG